MSRPQSAPSNRGSNQAESLNSTRTSERNSEMPTEVARTEYGVLIHHDEWNTLELKWLPTTKDATEAEARDMMVWRDKEIIPHYNAGGPAKFAFIVGEGVPFPTVESGAVPAPDGPATFPTGWFTSRDRAYQWLAE